MSLQRTRIETAMSKPVPLTDAEWEKVVDDLNALNMTEMLSTLAAVTDASKRKLLQDQAKLVLSTKCGWEGSWQRINFAFSVVNDKKITFYPNDLEADQADDARNFLTPSWPVRGSMAGRAMFDTINQAAVRAISEVNPASIALDAEFAGSLFASMGQFGFTKPARGDVEKVNGKWRLSSSSSIPVPPGTTKSGMYHTHGGGIGNTGAEVASGDDIMIMVAQKVFSFIGTPQGHIKKLTPNVLLYCGRSATARVQARDTQIAGSQIDQRSP